MREPKFLKHYRPNVGLCVFNHQAQVWLGRRASGTLRIDKKDQHIWQLPQGGIDEGEDPLEAAYRELEEETGMHSVEPLFITPGWMAYNFPEGYKRKASPNKYWHGQRQKWVVMIFQGDDSEVNLDAHHKAEFDDWRWADLDEITDLIVPFKKGIYEELVTAISPLAEFIRRSESV